MTVYGQTAGTGKLYSHPSGGAAIGGISGHDYGNIVINGEELMYDWDAVMLGRYPRAYYADEEAYSEDQVEYYYSNPMPENLTLYALWVQPAEAAITVTPPVCGTEVAYTRKTGVYVWAQPGPQLAVEGHCHFEDYDFFL